MQEEPDQRFFGLICRSTSICLKFDLKLIAASGSGSDPLQGPPLYMWTSSQKIHRVVFVSPSADSLSPSRLTFIPQTLDIWTSLPLRAASTPRSPPHPPQPPGLARRLTAPGH